MSEAATTAIKTGEHAGPTASDYIVHHLTHWQNKKQTEIVDFSVFNYDSIFFSVLLGLVGSFCLCKAAKKATSGVRGRLQSAFEIVFDMVNVHAQLHAGSVSGGFFQVADSALRNIASRVNTAYAATAAAAV